MPVTLPDPETLRVFHGVQLQRFGGAPGMRDPGLLDAAVGRVRTAMGYVDLDAIEAAAMLCHAVLKSHAFVDGNKRTAYGALVMTLASAGLRLEAPDDAIAEMILHAAGASDDHRPIDAWVRERVGEAEAGAS